MANIDNKVLWGFRNIHIAKIIEDGTYGVPVQLNGGKKVECSFNVKETKREADDTTYSNKIRITDGSGTLSVMGLTIDERCMLAGTENMSGGFYLSSDMTAQPVAILFEQQKDDNGKMLYVIYNATFKPNQIAATAVEDGNDEAVVYDLDFTCIVGSNGKFYGCVDTTDSKVDSTQVSEWFTEVQQPKETAGV